MNCGAVAPNLIESELFGHERGSFTGADRVHKGYFERSNRGTLFLDEITEMTADLQVKLLRVLETGSITRIGGTEAIKVDVRVIAATNRVPEEAVAEGKLRQDMFYRLSVFPIPLPPLRERREDIELLAEHFLAQLNKQEGTAKRLGVEAVERLCAYDWPGNVRELRNAIHRAFIMAEDEIVPELLPVGAPVPEPSELRLGDPGGDDGGGRRAPPHPGHSERLRRGQEEGGGRAPDQPEDPLQPHQGVPGRRRSLTLRRRFRHAQVHRPGRLEAGGHVVPVPQVPDGLEERRASGSGTGGSRRAPRRR